MTTTNIDEVTMPDIHCYIFRHGFEYQGFHFAVEHICWEPDLYLYTGFQFRKCISIGAHPVFEGYDGIAESIVCGFSDSLMSVIDAAIKEHGQDED
jgi:hypothetical protein